MVGRRPPWSRKTSDVWAAGDYIGCMTRARLDHDYGSVGLFPLPNLVFFPHQLLPLQVFEARYRALVEDALQTGRLIGVPRLQPGYEADYEGCPAIHRVFGIGRILEHRRLPDGRFVVVLQGVDRVRLVREIQGEAFRVAEVEALADFPAAVNLAPLRSAVTLEGERLLRREEAGAAQLITRAKGMKTGAASRDYIEADLIQDPDERQALLENRDPALRLARMLELLRGLADHVEGASGLRKTPDQERWN